MIDHPPPDALRELVRGTLPEAGREAILTHLESCDRCFALVDDDLPPILDLGAVVPWEAARGRSIERRILGRTRRATTLNDGLDFALSGLTTLLLALVEPWSDPEVDRRERRR